ncbi:DUF2207 domain-containing protein [uncultured Chitinophaga sp.]|uniref:DUF2207 domain-containing protein n=1 Tax=uncultured Chitinophaga sp. TaxID=339340 RepID=UPI0025E030A3|nr:DUF2207 domain-containing protein [uncultured Chitinophaga sp.]
MKRLLILLFALLPLAGAVIAQDTMEVSYPQEPDEHYVDASYQEEPEQHYSEGIIDFHADIVIEKNGLVKITEHIKVFATGNEIKRGIFRELPGFRKNKYGRRVDVPIHVTSVLKDGHAEPYSTKEEAGWLNIRIGSADVLLSTGVYDYTITYESRGHVGFFDGYDELYWNVTGNDWKLPIVKASATVTLPDGASVKQSACYTGEKGSTASDCSMEYDRDQHPVFKTERLMSPGSGFTIAVGFTAGIIERPPPPGLWGMLVDWFLNFIEYVLAGIGLLVLLPYLYNKWRKYGKDPEKPVVVARFEPPDGLSPASMRYIYKKVHDSRSLAAALVNMAVKKVITIRKEEGKFFIERKKGKIGLLAQEERELCNKLLHTNQTIEVDDSNKFKFSAAREAFEKELKTGHNLTEYFQQNKKHMWRGGLVTMLVLSVYLAFINVGSLIFLVFLVPFIVIGLSLLFAGIKALKQGCAGVFLLLMGVVFSLVPMGILLTAIWQLPVVSIVFVVGVIVCFAVYMKLVQAPTEMGTKVMAEIEGFCLYLSVAEEDRLDMLTPPERTPELFERLLPYAIALELENAWGKKFKDVLESIQYSPEWYSGGTFSYVHFGDSFSNRFASSVDRAAKSPEPVRSSGGSSSSGSSSSGSSSWSSGSSGGGSSGGGGGGGGGGGW